MVVFELIKEVGNRQTLRTDAVYLCDIVIHFKEHFNG